MKILSKIIILHIIVIITFLTSFFPGDKLRILTHEDGLVEWVGALFYLGSSIIFAYLFLSSRDKENKFIKIKTSYNFYYFILGVVFFLAFSEEISWGQRFLGIATPVNYKDINVQSETNIHNLYIFQKYDLNQLFVICFIIFCFVFPLLSRYSKGANRYFREFKFPIPPVWVGSLYILSYVMTHIVKDIIPMDRPGSMDEIKETNYAFISCVLAYHFKNKKDK